MATTHHVPPAGRQARPRRKSLEQLEAKYKALMRNMLIYQQVRKRNICGGSAAKTGTGTNMKSEPGTTGRVDEKTHQQQLMFQATQTLPTPSSSVSPASSTTNLEATSNSKQNQTQQQSTPQHNPVPSSTLREHQRERPPQKRLQNASNGPKPAYDRRETGSSARHSRPMPAAIQLAYEELTSMQRHQTPQPPQQQQQQPQQHQHQHQQHQYQQHQPSHQPQQHHHQGSPPISIPRPANIQIPPHYLQQQYMHHVSPQLHPHHQPLASPLPAHYTAHHNVQTISAPYTSYDASGMPPKHPYHPHQQQHGLPSYEHNGNVEGDLLDCFVSNINEI
ncbi:hypothetical protein F5B22DRAFT_650047 [Xylaria bambusicola]|uniref:uncharacterized protein n=1 Tax=Xylaria bambusicola TaxID=326684 RepID=UPI002008C43E|nr:uncharacterized protein F5B22DRAFT_650047 [Xylaria bambusicola]KAI0508380.1 hypothetical protein F5B22DRAFT_650047 [Xylaria bambusicola]